MNFDQIESASVFPAGWFQFAHPRYLNRNRMIEFMIEQHHDKEISKRINIYPRQFREKNSEGESVRSDVLWVNGAWESKEDIMSFLLGIQWQDTYHGINFIPFQTNDHFTKDHQVDALKEHNKFCESLSSEVLHSPYPDAILENNDDYTINFVDWLATQTFENNDLFYDVDKIGNSLVTLSYFSTKSKSVDEFIDNIEEILSNEYESNVLDDIFGIHNGIQILRSTNKNAQKYLNNLAEKSGSNPQGNENDRPSHKKVHVYYGVGPVNDNSSGTTYADIASAPTSSSTTKQIAELRATVERLDKSHKQLEQSVTSNVTNNLSAQFNTKIDDLDRKVITKIKAVEGKHTSTVEKLFEEWERRNQATKNMILGMCNGLDQTSMEAPRDETEGPESGGPDIVPGVSQ